MSQNNLSKKQKYSHQKKTQPIELYFLIGLTVLIIPLVYVKQIIDPTLVPRLLGLGVVVAIFILISLFNLNSERIRYAFLRLNIFPNLLLYFIWSVISITYAINPSEGLFDLTRIFFSGLFLVITTQVMIKYNNARIILVKFVIASSIVASATGLHQYFGNIPGKTGVELSLALYKVMGLMAHKNQYSISLFLMLPFVFFGIHILKKFWWWISIFSALMILLNIVILQTRSVWVALVVFLFIFAICWILFSIKNRVLIGSNIAKRGVIIGIIFLLISLGSTFIFHKTGTLLMVKNQANTLFDANSHSNQGRLIMWGATWKLAKDHIGIGVGAGNWKISIPPYSVHNLGAEYQNWRRPHNDFLWILSEKGIVGLLLYLSIFSIIGYYSIKIIFSKTDKGTKTFTALLLSGIIGFLSISMVSFPMERTNHQIYLALMIAAIVSTYYLNKKEKPLPFSSKANKWSHILIIAITVFGLYYSGLLLRSEYYIKKTKVARQAQNWKMMDKYTQEAYTNFTKVDPFSEPIRLYNGIANINMGKIGLATDYLNEAYHDCPSSIAVLNNLGVVAAKTNQNEKAIYYFNKSLDIFPNFSASGINLVKIYYKLGDYQQAYIALLKCDSKNTSKKQYDNLMKDLINRMNSSKEN